MKFRYSAFGFILLANIILLGHSALPHHHYETHVEIIHHEEALDHQHNHDEVFDVHNNSDFDINPFHDHKEKSDDRPRNCLLSDIIALPAHEYREILTLCQFDSKDLHDLISLFKSDFNFNNIPSERAKLIYVPPNELCFCGIYSNIIGLRGPPHIS